MIKEVLEFLASCDDFETCKKRCNELLKAEEKKPIIKIKKEVKKK